MIYYKWESFKWWLRGEWYYYKPYLPELRAWLAFTVCLSLTCFLIGFSVGVFSK
jgi:hypothetical protein